MLQLNLSKKIRRSPVECGNKIKKAQRERAMSVGMMYGAPLSRDSNPDDINYVASFGRMLKWAGADRVFLSDDFDRHIINYKNTLNYYYMCNIG